MLKTAKQQSIVIIIGGVGAFVLLIVLMNAFSPDQFVPIGALSIFGLIYVVCYAVIYVMYNLATGIFNILVPSRSNIEQRYYRRCTYVAIISMVPVIILAIQSIRDVVAMEVVLVLIFCGLTCFYISRR